MRKLICIVFLFSVTLCHAQKVIGTFVGMEYRGMSNLTYKVYITSQHVTGVKVNGYISIKNSFGIGYVVPKDQLHNPNAYINKSAEKNYDQMNPDSDNLWNVDPANFMINRKDIKEVYNNPKKKWGMGYYPYSGRIFILSPKTKKNRQKKREFILVGDQNTQKILKLLKKEAP